MGAAAGPEDASWWGSDARYFGLLAAPEAVEGGTLFVAPRHADLPPGFVASVPGAAAVADPGGWLSALTCRARAAGARLLRAYLPEAPTTLAAHLCVAGFAPRAEVGLLLDDDVALPPAPADFERVESEEDWADELALQRCIRRGWCGGDLDPERWVAMERAQCEGGGVERLLLRVDGEPAASFGAVTADDLLRRPKSIVVHPAHRGRGHVAGAFVCLRARAGSGAGGGAPRPLGAIAVEGGPGHRSYARLGLRPVFRFVEWTRAAA